MSFHDQDDLHRLALGDQPVAAAEPDPIDRLIQSADRVLGRMRECSLEALAKIRRARTAGTR